MGRGEEPARAGVVAGVQRRGEDEGRGRGRGGGGGRRGQVECRPSTLLRSSCLRLSGGEGEPHKVIAGSFHSPWQEAEPPPPPPFLLASLSRRGGEGETKLAWQEGEEAFRAPLLAGREGPTHEKPGRRGKRRKRQKLVRAGEARERRAKAARSSRQLPLKASLP